MNFRGFQVDAANQNIKNIKILLASTFHNPELSYLIERGHQLIKRHPVNGRNYLLMSSSYQTLGWHEGTSS